MPTKPALGDHVNGAWSTSPADNWPLVAVHAVLTPDGRVLTFGSDSGGNATGYFQYDVWDPEAGLEGGHVTLQNLTLVDILCGYALTLPDSSNILIAGGDTWTGSTVSNIGNASATVYQGSDSALSVNGLMKRPRWYATATPLMNGEIYVQGGKGGADFPEVRDSAGQFRLLTGVPTSALNWYYPRNFLAPDGRVFGFDIKGNMYFVSTAGDGSYVPAGQMGTENVEKISPVAMFRPGKLLQVSGKTTRSVLVIDINGTQPAITTTGSLSATRAWANATLLADGQVLVTGGSKDWNKLVEVTNYAEIWNPATGQWKVGASGVHPRLYHSIALLLPDASVLVSGGGASSSSPLNNLNAEIYHPPYLFDANGGFAIRPRIETAPEALTAGLPFQILTDTSDIQRLSLVQTGAATHTINLQQRFIELAFTAEGSTLFAEMPARQSDTPPGYYLLFAINGDGVPSKARIVRVNPGTGNPDPDPDPDPEPGDTVPPSVPAGLAVTKVNGNPRLSWTASTDNVAVTGYAIYRSTNGTLGTEIARTQSTAWTDIDVTEGVKYTYGVKAYDAEANASAASGLKSIVAFQAPTKPGSFSLTLSNNDPRLNFAPSTDNVGVVGYNVYRSTNGKLGPLFKQVAGPPWVDTSATKGVKYTYAVKARDAAGYLSAATPLKTITAK